MLRKRSALSRAGKLFGVGLAYLLALAPLPGLPPAARAQTADQALIPVIAPGSAYRQTNLVSDSAGLAPVEACPGNSGP